MQVKRWNKRSISRLPANIEYRHCRATLAMTIEEHMKALPMMAEKAYLSLCHSLANLSAILASDNPCFS